MTPGVFMFLAALAVISALGTVVQRNPVHCLLALVVTLLTIAVIFIGLDAVTVGFLQAIVYAGAIMVLFLFVIWLLNLQAELRSVPGYLALKAISGLLCAALVAELFVLLGICAQRGRRSGGRAHRLRIDRDARHDALFRLPDRLRGDLGALAGGDRRRDRAGPAHTVLAGRLRARS